MTAYASVPVRERNLPLEREVTLTAAKAVGLAHASVSLRDFADARCMPGPIRLPRDWDQEAAEEIADCANYLVWALTEDYAGYLSGEPEPTARFERRMRALSRLVEAWHDLMTEAH